MTNPPSVTLGVPNWPELTIVFIQITILLSTPSQTRENRKAILSTRNWSFSRLKITRAPKIQVKVNEKR